MKLDLGKKNLVSENIWTFWWQKRVHKSINQQAFTEYLDQRCSNDRLKCLLGWKSCKCVFFCGKVSLDKAFAECYHRIFCTFVHRGWFQLCTHFAWGLLGSDFKESHISRCDTKNKNQLGELCTHQTGTLLSSYWLIITVCIRVNDLEGLSYDDKTILFETVFSHHVRH